MTIDAARLNTAVEACLDRTACLVPDVQTFSDSESTWTKPPHALFIDFTLVGAGRNGAAGSASHLGGAGGGASGPILQRRVPSSMVPATLTVLVQATQSAQETQVYGSGFDITAAVGTVVAPTVPNSDSGTAGGTATGEGCKAGGAGGDGNVVAASAAYGAAGGAGYCAAGGAGGPPGTVGTPAAQGGQGGRGYGAGGGGGAGAASYGGGGGGGASGWGYVELAGDGGGSGAATGGTGAPGIVVITTWRGVAL